METSLSNILETARLPENRPWMDNVIRVFINGIPEDCHKYCLEYLKEEGFSDKDLNLPNYVRHRLQILSEREYKLWINGRMPYITPRELQLWRLRQFVQYIWFWNLPDDNDLAMIFNETKRKASNLINDFIARFRKTLLFPVSIRRLYMILKNEPNREKVSHKDKDNVLGNLYNIMNKRYLDDCNMLINEIRTRTPSIIAISNSYFYDKDILSIWVDCTVIELVTKDNSIINEIFNIYPTPEQEHD